MTLPFVLRWGILSTGLISSRFVSDLVKNGATRGTHDVEHKITVVASRSLDTAQSFIDKHLHCHSDGIRAVGSYQEVYNDPNVDVIYISTPHSHHYRNAKDALLAGKPVLLEKPSTVTAEQMIELVEIASEKKLFLMEALWTRFIPLLSNIQNRIKNGEIGKVKFVDAQFGRLFDKNKSRFTDPHLAGGSFMDIGPYPYTWIALILGQSSAADTCPKMDIHDITAHQILTSEKIGEMYDESTVVTWKVGDAVGILKTSMYAETLKDLNVYITGTRGQILVPAPIFRPPGFTIRRWRDEEHNRASIKPESEEYVEQEYPDKMLGFAWEADEVARCIRDGKLESDRMPLDESIQMMKAFDEIRRQGGLKYPMEIESVDPDNKVI